MSPRKIAVIKEIKANKYALNKFLKYVDYEKIDTIFNLGNFIKNGPNPEEVLE